jgi:deoxyribodipyrimidine photo-lyase
MHNFQNKSEMYQFVQSIDPIRYEQTRNNLKGSVTMLSPYITAGVITLNEIKYMVLAKNKLSNCYKLIQELAWRDFFQSVYIAKKYEIFESIRHEQEGVVSNDLPKAILDANTGITAIDSAIKRLYETGYIHNHERMWLASIICNIAGTNWQTGAKWMYYYLLDGDVASNMLSWQWCAGTFSSKKYYANQENINKYAGFKQLNTFMDRSYEELPEMEVPEKLTNREGLKLNTKLNIPDKYIYKTKVNENVMMLNKNTINSNYTEPNYDYVLYIDVDEQKEYPISQNRLDFVIKMIDMELPECKILLATSTEMKDIRAQYGVKLSKEQARMFPTLTDYYPSFFKFWDKAEKLV